MSQSAAVMVLDEIPSEEEIDALIDDQLDAYDEEDGVSVSVDITERSSRSSHWAPEWMDLCEQDQVNAHMRDGGACVLVLYITIHEDEYLEDDDF